MMPLLPSLLGWWLCCRSLLGMGATPWLRRLGSVGRRRILRAWLRRLGLWPRRMAVALLSDHTRCRTTKGDAWQTYRPSLATFHQPVLH